MNQKTIKLKMRNKLYTVLVFVLVAGFCGKIAAQELTINNNQELKFFNYLIENKLFNDAIKQTKLFDYSNLSSSQKDSVFFFKGYSFYNLEKSDSSFYCFQNLSDFKLFLFAVEAFVLYKLFV